MNTTTSAQVRPVFLALLGVAFFSLAGPGCSALGGNGPGDGNGAGAGSGDGDAPGDGDITLGDGDINLGDGDGDGDGDSTNTTGSGDPCGPDTACPSGEICVSKDLNACASEEAKASSLPGACQKPLAACTADTECLGDTRCCSGDCRLDGMADGQCVRVCGVNESCKKDQAAVGVFSPSVQCEWSGPAADDPFPVHNRIMATPLVANTPHNSGEAAEIIIVTGDEVAGAEFGDFREVAGGVFGQFEGGSQGGVIRILNGQTCEQIEVINTGDFVRSPATPSIADLDNDGNVEIVARSQWTSLEDTTQLVAFRWDGSKYAKYWKTSVSSASPIGTSNRHWDGPSIHDLTGDDLPEVIGRNGAVFNGTNGNVIANPDSNIAVYSDPVLGDIDDDGTPDLIANKVFSWNGSGWTQKYVGPNKAASAAPWFYAYADFGTPNGDSFDFQTLDGVAEIVTSGLAGFTEGNGASGHVAVYTLDGQELLNVDLDGLAGTTNPSQRGGPATIGDFDNDGRAEIALAAADVFSLIDPDCAGGGAGCAAPYVRWVRPSQDASSAQTGSSIFDFESDGRAEAVYADECFLRIYDGESGDVLFSQFRSSCTWWENAVIADPDRDTRTEILVNSNLNCNVTCNGDKGPDAGSVDPIHPGVRCETNEDCVSDNCVEGFCRCTNHAECGTTDIPDPVSQPSANIAGLVCVAPLAGTPGAGNVCRMQHPNSNDVNQKKALNSLKVLRDVLDRWSDSRPLWNQHAYSITNINDDGSVPSASEWEPNFTVPGLNNFRQNVQGPGGANLLPDITGILNRDNICAVQGGSVMLTAEVCNRGLRTVGADMPATFYLGQPAEGQILCTSYTEGPVKIGDFCLPVSCTFSGSVADNSEIYMVVNDDGQGNATTEECDTENNIDSVVVPVCAVVK